MASRQDTDPEDRPTWVDRSENPFLDANHAPTVQESTAVNLEVGLPRDLDGAYPRSGPNQVFEPDNLCHWSGSRLGGPA